jgi:uncharacterized protein YdeI (YjbR/CyaY-like superfamily)
MSKDNSEKASYEQKAIEMPVKFVSLFKKNKKAWQYFQNEAPYYRKQSTWWVVSAKQEETQMRRLKTLIEDSEKGIRIKPLRR